jgi:hypothetical protein
MNPSGEAVVISRSQVLAYRAAAHDLERRRDHPLDCRVFRTGVVDNPPGRSARLSTSMRSGQVVTGSDVAVVHSVRGVMHAHPVADLELYASALCFDDAADVAGLSLGSELAERGIGFGDAICGVAEAMARVMADGALRTKGELSTAVASTVDRRLTAWCDHCATTHVHDDLFRYATLQAGLRISVESGKKTIRFRYFRAAGPRSTLPDAAASRRELVRRFLSLCGPATHEQVGQWLGVSPVAARRLLHGVQDELIPVNVEGWLAWMHSGDLKALHEAPAAAAARLLPPLDPFTGICAWKLVMMRDETRPDVWRAAAHKAVMVLRGEIVGVWGLRICRDRITVFLRPFDGLPPADREAFDEPASFLGAHFGVPEVDVRYVPDRPL